MNYPEIFCKRCGSKRKQNFTIHDQRECKCPAFIIPDWWFKLADGTEVKEINIKLP